MRLSECSRVPSDIPESSTSPVLEPDSDDDLSTDKLPISKVPPYQPPLIPNVLLDNPSPLIQVATRPQQVRRPPSYFLAII